MISVPVAVTSSRMPASSEPVNRFAIDAPVNPFPDPLAKLTFIMSTGLSARNPSASTPRPVVEDQLRIEPGGNAANAVTFATVVSVVPFAEDQADDVKSIPSAQEQAAPLKSAMINVKMFLCMY